jgi:peptide/nickel transport system ATP-binding protein
MSTGLPLLKVDGLTTRFRTPHGAVTAVNDVSLELQPGRILGLVGESGSGKSVTALSLLNLVDKPGEVSTRAILFRGEPLHQASPARWSALRGDRIALVSQDPMMSLNPVIRIGDQLTETIRIHRRLSTADARRIAIDALERVGIPAPVERMKAWPHELSGGMRQRVAIANALVNQPDLIIADEPTTALDVTIQAQILYEMKRLARDSGTALIWITHDLAVVKDLADELCVMYAGRIVERGPVAELIRAPRHPYTRGLLDSLPRGRSAGGRLTPIRGAAPPLSELPSGCAFAPRCPRAVAACAELPPLAAAGGREFRCTRPL